LHPLFPKLEHAFTISIELAGLQWVKPTSMGATRAAVYAAAGKIEGPRLNGPRRQPHPLLRGAVG